MSKIVRLDSIFSKWVVIGMIIASLFALAAPNIAGADAPVKETFFICPSVSTHSPNGMWVVGTHGAYYVNIPTKGGANGGSKVFLTVPVSVPDLAQVPAGWGLYKDLPTFPNFEGMALLLGEGISTWLGSPAGWAEGDMAAVANNGDRTYTVTNLTLGSSVTINSPIPLASAAVW
ncbi:MAG: hypothetical protein P8Y03_14750 [Anaerolineales bacterium]|jgi:hypothetical protein